MAAESMQELSLRPSRPTDAPILRTSSRVARSHRWEKTLSWYSQNRPFSWAQMPPSDSSQEPGMKALADVGVAGVVEGKCL